MICLNCAFYSKDREQCDYNFDIEFDINSYQPPCCRDDEEAYICTSYDYKGGNEYEQR